MKFEKEPTLADSICDLRTRKMKKPFFKQINTLIDWEKISFLIDTHYQKDKSASGKPSYAVLLLFKVCLLQAWYGLSDYEVEGRINDSISFGYFCRLNIDQAASSQSTLSRFRTALTKSSVFELLFAAINSQLETNKTMLNAHPIPT